MRAGTKAVLRCLRWGTPVALAVALSPLAASGCGTSAIGVNDCKQVEEARCNAAAKCSAIQLTPPYSTSGSSVDACIRFYDTACLHGLAGIVPSASQLQACLSLIKTGGCTVVAEPWNAKDTSCSWLIPPNVPEASPDAEGGEGGEAGDANDASQASDDGAGE